MWEVDGGREFPKVPLCVGGGFWGGGEGGAGGILSSSSAVGGKFSLVFMMYSLKLSGQTLLCNNRLSGV